jgi:hypothetical protein
MGTAHRLTGLIAFGGLALGVCAAPAQTRPSVVDVESTYADTIDAVGVLTTMDSGLFTRFADQDRAAWATRYGERRAQLVTGLDALERVAVAPSDRPALARMRASLASVLPEDPYRSTDNLPAPRGHCRDASNPALDGPALADALYACFDEFGNRLEFEGGRVARDSALALLGQMNEPARRKALFLAFTPLWEAVNGHDEPTSPYRRRIRFAAADAAANGSPIDKAARAVERTGPEVERWLEAVLEAWRRALPDRPVEPWDYRYAGGAADRALFDAIPLQKILEINERYYRDLGADFKRLGVLYDLDPRPGKAPVTYASFVTMGRELDGRWRPTVSRISASFTTGGLYVMNMLVHESGHVMHYSGIHTRPAFMDVGNDDIFTESFADVASWDVYDSAWQSKYLGRGASTADGLRSRFTMVTLEVAWALFEARMLRRPDADPNVVWSDITSHYLHIVRHPELSWWCQRVQLVTDPGFMINYGLGAVITADIRQHTRRSIGAFATGNAAYFPWMSEHLIRTGSEFDTSKLMRDFLGRPVSPAALIEDIGRLRH